MKSLVEAVLEFYAPLIDLVPKFKDSLKNSKRASTPKIILGKRGDLVEGFGYRVY